MTNLIRNAMMVGMLALGIGFAGGGVAIAGPFDECQSAYENNDFAAALKTWRELADQGDADAQVNLGFAYQNGQGVRRDAEEAVKWYQLAADQGNAKGQCYLGAAYEHGWGVARDGTEAVRWYRLAAEQGDADGMFSLGEMYFEGIVVEKSDMLGYMWMSLAVGRRSGAENLLFTSSAAMSYRQIARAQEMATKCEASGYRNCDSNSDGSEGEK